MEEETNNQTPELNQTSPDPEINPTGSNASWWSKYKLLLIVGGVVLIIVAAGVALMIKNSQQDEPKVTEQKQDVVTKREPQPAQVEEWGYLSLEAKSAEEKFKLGKEYELEILMNTNGYNISAASAIINYDPTIFEVVKIDTSDSVMTLGAEKSIKDGQVRVIRGKPGDAKWDDSDDGFTGERGLLATLVVKPLKAGKSKFEFVKDKSKMILDDGMGTGMKVKYTDGEYKVGE